MGESYCIECESLSKLHFWFSWTNEAYTHYELEEVQSNFDESIKI